MHICERSKESLGKDEYSSQHKTAREKGLIKPEYYLRLAQEDRWYLDRQLEKRAGGGMFRGEQGEQRRDSAAKACLENRLGKMKRSTARDGTRT